MRVGSNSNEEDHRIGPYALKGMLRTGVFVWIGLYLLLGKLAHRGSNFDLERCIEEVADLRVQQKNIRLSQWLMSACSSSKITEGCATLLDVGLFSCHTPRQSGDEAE